MFFKLFKVPLAFFYAVIVFFPSTGVCKGDVVFSATINKDSKKIECSEEEAFSSFKSCVEYLSTKSVGKKLVDLVDQLLEIYFLFEAKSTFCISEGTPSFAGLNSRTPPIKNGGNKRVFIRPTQMFIRPKQETQKTQQLLSKVLILEESEKDENGYYPLKVKERNVSLDSEINGEDAWVLDIYISSEVFITYESFKQNFDVDIRNEETEKRSPVLALAFPKNVQPEDFDSKDPQKSPFFIVLAHELLHMKHFLEEQVFLHQVALRLARLCCVERSQEVIEAVKALCEISNDIPMLEEEIHQLILSSVKSFKKFKELSGLARKHKIDTTCPMQFDDQSQSFSIADLALFPYSASKENKEAEVQKFFAFVKRNYERFSNDMKSFPDLEEIRTVLGPDRDGITENVIRREFGVSERRTY